MPAPTGVAACGGNGQLTVQFNAVTGAQSYDVYYNASAPATAGSKMNVAGPATIAVANGTWHIAVAAVNAVGDGAASADVTALADSQVHDTLFVAAADSNAVDMFDCASQLPDGTAAPSRSLALGAAPVGLAVDAAGNVLYVGDGVVEIWTNASNVSGTKASDYVNMGSGAGAVAVDTTNKKLYVAQNGSVTRYGYAALADLNGNPTSEATLFSPAGSGPLHQLYVNPANGDLWGAAFQSGGANPQCGATGMWSKAYNKSGGATHYYRVNGDASCDYYGIAYLPANGGTLYVGEASVWWITSIDSNAGGITYVNPSGTLAQAAQAIAIGNNMMWVLPTGTNGQVMMWSVSSLSGSPTKTFSSAHTHGNGGAIFYVP
jgi:hypothetical protein